MITEIKSKNKFCYSISRYFAFIYGQLNQTLQLEKERKIKNPQIGTEKKISVRLEITFCFQFMWKKKKLRVIFIQKLYQTWQFSIRKTGFDIIFDFSGIHSLLNSFIIITNQIAMQEVFKA